MLLDLVHKNNYSACFHQFWARKCLMVGICIHVSRQFWRTPVGMYGPLVPTNLVGFGPSTKLQVGISFSCINSSAVYPFYHQLAVVVTTMGTEKPQFLGVKNHISRSLGPRSEHIYPQSLQNLAHVKGR